jgi:adenylate kinase family enzyme
VIPAAKPRRILVMGPAGSGKSRLALLIGERLGLPVIHLDRLFWLPGWEKMDFGDFREVVSEAAAAEAWIMDGNYASALRERLGRAELVIYLDYPRWVTIPRVLWRWLRHRGGTRPDMAPDCPEQLDREFLHYMWTFPHTSRPRHFAVLRTEGAHARQVILRSNAEVGAFLETL